MNILLTVFSFTTRDGRPVNKSLSAASGSDGRTELANKECNKSQEHALYNLNSRYNITLKPYEGTYRKLTVESQKVLHVI